MSKIVVMSDVASESDIKICMIIHFSECDKGS